MLPAPDPFTKPSIWTAPMHPNAYNTYEQTPSLPQFNRSSCNLPAPFLDCEARSSKDTESVPFSVLQFHTMANAAVPKREEELLPSSIFDSPKGENLKSRGQMLERKIDILEGLAGTVSNRRSRRWVNDRLLIELVPRLNVEEIRGLFAPPPWGENTPLSAFCMTNVGEWDAFRNVDMDTEVTMIQALENSSTKRKDLVDTDKMIALNAWRRVDCRTREALRRSFLPDLITSYEEHIRAFVEDGGDDDVLVLHVQDPFRRLVLHGVCEYYNLISATVSTSRDTKVWKMTKIKKKIGLSGMPPNITLASFLKMAKEGVL